MNANPREFRGYPPDSRQPQARAGLQFSLTIRHALQDELTGTHTQQQ